MKDIVFTDGFLEELFENRVSKDIWLISHAVNFYSRILRSFLVQTTGVQGQMMFD